ncbi:MAG: hypothetical protein Q7R35_01785 [Elusimicrobiota bacterium]|nr:hypothetical protein [Elusimicrobiota bacterium]
MKCPNCGFEAPDDAAECRKCQVIFKKHGESAVNKALKQHVARAKGPVKDTSSPLPRLFIMFLITAAIYFYLEHTQKPPVPAANPAVQTEPAPAPLENQWKFEGRVLDLLRDKPISGAKLIFSDPNTGGRFPAETDFDGYYSLDLKPLERGGYEAQISHPDLSGQWYDAEYAAALTKTQRYQLSGQVQFRAPEEWARHMGKAGFPTKYNFAIFPANLTEDEKKEQHDALSGKGARS